MANAVSCSDQLIARFIRDIKNKVSLEHTIIVLLSDHLAMLNTLWDALSRHQKDRRLLFHVFEDQSTSANDTSGTHFDVAPTIMQFAGFDDYSRSRRRAFRGLSRIRVT